MRHCVVACILYNVIKGTGKQAGFPGNARKKKAALQWLFSFSTVGLVSIPDAYIVFYCEDYINDEGQ